MSDVEIPDFAPILKRAKARKGGKAKLEALLPEPLSAAELAAIGDDRYLSQFTKSIFQAGFVWRIIEKKWPNFEEVFVGFDPQKLQYMFDETMEEIVKDKRIVRNMQKIATVRYNAQMMVRVAEEHGSFAKFVAEWPSDDMVGLWWWLKKHGARLGGRSCAYALWFMGKDSWIPAADVMRRMRIEGVIHVPHATTKRDLTAIQTVFNAWAEETGLPYMQLSRIAAYSIGAAEREMLGE